MSEEKPTGLALLRVEFPPNLVSKLPKPTKAQTEAVNHGHTRTANGKTVLSPTYRSWAAMLQRCTNEARSNYKYYGGRGITYEERWGNFREFLLDMGERSDGTTLDRYPNKNGNYERGNCRWATWSEQQSNKRSNRLLTVDGLTLTVSAWARKQGIRKKTLFYRLNCGWSVTDALTKTANQAKRETA